jgi:hypothetical protein
VNHKLERIWKEVAVAEVEVLYWHMSVGTKAVHEESGGLWAEIAIRDLQNTGCCG